VKRFLLLLFFLLISIGLISCSRNEKGMEKPSSPEVGGVAPDFVLKDIEGKDVQLSHYRGKMIVLEFWATWCPPCKATIPELIAVQTKYAGRGVVVLGVSIDEGGEIQSRLSVFSKDHKINYPVLLGTEKVINAYNVMGIPATFLIGKDQKIISAYRGYVDRLEAIVSQQVDKTI
jgi:peroxiredoxin